MTYRYSGTVVDGELCGFIVPCHMCGKPIRKVAAVWEGHGGDGRALTCVGECTDAFAVEQCLLRADTEKLGGMTLPVFSNATRPASGKAPAGTMIFNTDDRAPNFSDGAHWRDSAGAPT